MGLTRRVSGMLAVMRRLGLAELDVRVGPERVALRRPSPVAGRPQAVRPQAVAERAPTAEVAGHPVPSPLAGTFYATPRPGAEPFVRVGDSVRQGVVIGMVEAMKVFNEVTADAAGRVIHVLARSGDTVTAGQPLVILDERDQPPGEVGL